MKRIRLKAILLACTLSLAPAYTHTALADTTSSNAVVMENCGAYLFEWRPVGYENGKYFAILVGGDTINESDVILNRGYDYPYTFNPSIPRPWGQVPDLVNVNGQWGIPENWANLPEGTQPTLRITLVTNNKKLPTNERYIDVVRLPGGVDSSTLPAEVRKYLINVDGSDAGAYSGTVTNGWDKQDGKWIYRKPDGGLVTNGWLNVDDENYYMDENGFMLADTITPDGVYVNAKGEKTNYMPGWVQNDRGWKYVLKHGYYAASTWVQGADGNWYYFDIGGYMVTDKQTPDGYYVDVNGVWDGQPTTITVDTESLGPGAVQNTQQEEA